MTRVIRKYYTNINSVVPCTQSDQSLQTLACWKDCASGDWYFYICLGPGVNLKHCHTAGYNSTFADNNAVYCGALRNCDRFGCICLHILGGDYMRLDV